MKKNVVMMLAAVAALALAGCKEDKPQEVVQTVEWFKEHKAAFSKSAAASVLSVAGITAWKNPTLRKLNLRDLQ